MYIWPVLLGAAFTGGLLQASCGFGSSMICMCVYSLVLPVKTALILQATASFFIISCYAYRFRRNVDWHLLLIPASVAVLTTFIGLKTASLIDAVLLKRCLGWVLVLLSLFSLLNRGNLKISKGVGGQIAAGGLSGFLGGLTNMSGPPMVLYMLQATEDKNTYNGTLQWFFLITSTSKMIMNIVNKRITWDILAMLPPLLLATAAGSYIGFRLFRKMDMKMVKKLVNTIMIFAGLYYGLA